MSRHTAPRRRGPRSVMARWSVQIRLVLCLGILALPAGVGTMAYWTDTATIRSGPIQTGTLDLTVGATVAESSQLPGQGGTFEYSQLTIANLIPGESIARPFVVRNSGSVSFRYNATIATENNNLVAPGSGLQVQIYVDGAPTNGGTEAAGNRSGTCTGTLVSTQLVSTSTGTVNIHAADQNLAPNGTRTYCARIQLLGSSPNSLQGQGTSLIIGLNATQLGAP